MCLQNQCPQCGYHAHSDSLANNHPLQPSPALDGDVDAINKKTRQLEAAIHKLSQERARLLRKLNQTQSSTRIFPVEILAIIFSHACPHPSQISTNTTSKANLHFQVVLGAVSSHWRQVAWSTPALWTAVTLNIRPATIQHDTILLALYLRNSNTYPIQLELDFPVDYKLGHGPTGDPKRLLERLKPLKDLLFSIHPDKVRNLKLDGMPFKWMSCLSRRFPRVESLLLGWWPGQKLGPATHPQAVTLTGFPQLRRVTIKRVMPQIVLPWDQITTLRCYKLPIDICVQLLVLCPNLAEYSNHLPTAPIISNPLDLDDILTDDKHVTLKHLTLLEWSYYPSTVCQKLQYFELPVLHTLLWSDSGQYQAAFFAFRGLLKNAPAVTSLTLSGKKSPTLMQDSVKWREVLTTRTPRLTQLRLNSIPHSLLEILNPTSRLNRGDLLNASGPLVLPSLEFLGLYVTGNFDRDLARLEDSPLIRMLASRRESSSTFKQVLLDIRQEVQWSDGVREKLLNLVRGGFKLEIIENSKMVDWL